VHQVGFHFNLSQPDGVTTRERPKAIWWECVWADIRGRITNLTEISSNRHEWKKVIEEVKVHGGLQGQLRRTRRKIKYVLPVQAVPLHLLT
jgi:hypothetical protein